MLLSKCVNCSIALSSEIFALPTGCNSIFRKIFKFKIWKEPMLVQKQTIHQQKALDLSFNLTPWKWAWHYHEAATPSRHRTTFFTPRAPMLCVAGGPSWLCHAHFQGLKLKLRSRAFCWGIVCFNKSIGSFQILNSKIFQIRLLHPVSYTFDLFYCKDVNL